ncbi:MAG: leucine-rich repeat domain-containing protein, partial [Propionibacteriaceae bacterium]|nr:leucine-rich repeat domain-containing protein [Propionibacteriaceae bacterium]
MTIRTTIARTLVASTLALAAVGFAQPLAHGDDNVIADPNLQACMNEAAGRVDGTPITAAELNGPLWTWRLDCTNRGVQSVEGLQYASQLTEFALNSNQITGISPLSGLPNLTYLGLSDNQITDADVAGLKDLPNLQAVNLANNQITNVSTITKTAFPQLSSVGLAGNAITDLSPLTTLFTENNTRLPALDQIVTLSPTTVGQPQPIPSVTLLDTAVAYDPAMTLDGTTLAMTPADPSSLTFDGDLV